MTLKELFQNDEHRWNAIFSLGYVVLVFVLAGLIWLVDRSFPKTLTLFDFILISLATFRLVRLFVYDKVTLFVRDYFTSHLSGPKKALADLLGCPWCFGVWAGTLVVFFYYVMPMAWLVLLILAIAGVASFIQILINKIGWDAELMKLETQKREGK